MSDRDYLYGHVCAHGSLARSCQVCDLEDEVCDLEDEVRRLRAERSAMLDALEAGQGLADLDTAPWEDRQSTMGEWDERIAHVHNLIGDDL